MSNIEIRQMPAFKKQYKKLPAAHQQKVEEAILAIIDNPTLGEAKKGDLTGVHVHKFNIHTQQMLLAYEWNPKLRLLLALGVHENFYRDLKKQRR